MINARRSDANHLEEVSIGRTVNPINTHGQPTLAGLHGRSYIIIYILYVERLDILFVLAHCIMLMAMVA